MIYIILAGYSACCNFDFGIDSSDLVTLNYFFAAPSSPSIAVFIQVSC